MVFTTERSTESENISFCFQAEPTPTQLFHLVGNSTPTGCEPEVANLKEVERGENPARVKGEPIDFL